MAKSCLKTPSFLLYLMKIIKITDKLYRVYNKGRQKDAWINSGEIMPPENPYNILTEEEAKAVKSEID